MFEGSGIAYKAMYVIGFVIMMIVNLKIYKKFELTKRTTVIFTLITYFAGVYGAMKMGDIYNVITEKFGVDGSSVAIFGAVVFTPLIMTAFAFVGGKSWRKIMDLLAPGIFIILACAKFGCFMGGCCPGRECSFGVYNPEYEMTMFPSQLFESITMTFIVGFCFWYIFRCKKSISGSVYPVTAAAYSVTRFFWEFMRYYEYEEMRHIMFGLSFWQFWCVVVIVFSVLWIILLTSEKVGSFEGRTYAFIDNCYKVTADKWEKFKHRNDKNIIHHKKKKKKNIKRNK